MAQPSDAAIRRQAAKIRNAQVRSTMNLFSWLGAALVVVGGLSPFLFPDRVNGWTCAILVVFGLGSFALALFLVRYICSEE